MNVLDFPAELLGGAMDRPAHDPRYRPRDDEHPFPLHFVPRMQAGHYTPFYLAPGGHVYLSYL